MEQRVLILFSLTRWSYGWARHSIGPPDSRRSWTSAKGRELTLTARSSLNYYGLVCGSATNFSMRLP
jgi:hypothetical protein